MTGNKLARLIRNTKGSIYVMMLIPNGVAPIMAKKADLVEWAESYGNQETGMQLQTNDGRSYLDSEG